MNQIITLPKLSTRKLETTPAATRGCVMTGDQKSESVAASFLREAANYFERRDEGGEDAAFWANLYNAQNCRRIADDYEAMLAALHPLMMSANAQVDWWKKEALRLRNIGANDSSAQDIAARWFKLFKDADAAITKATGGAR